MSLYDRIAATPEGERGLAAARLRRRMATIVELATGGRNTEELRQHSGLSRRVIRRIQRNPGSITIDEMAAYLWAGEYEADIKLVRAGQPRADVLAKRAVALGDRSIAIGGNVSGSVTTGDADD